MQKETCEGTVKKKKEKATICKQNRGYSKEIKLIKTLILHLEPNTVRK